MDSLSVDRLSDGLSIGVRDFAGGDEDVAQFGESLGRSDTDHRRAFEALFGLPADPTLIDHFSSPAGVDSHRMTGRPGAGNGARPEGAA